MSTLVFAQDLVGKYAGSFQRDPRANTIGLALDITGAEGGKLKGTITISTKGACRGTFPIEGTYDGNKIQTKTPTGGGAASDCGERAISGVVEGNRLVGTFVTQSGINVDITLTK
jgi:hypothetical protein